MSKLSMSRRSFLKTAAAAGAAMVLASSATAAMGLTPSEWTEDLRNCDPSSSGDVKRIRTACRGCGKCECGVFVTVKNGKAIKIEGDESAHHVNGNCCTKSMASLQAAYHPDRMLYPMKRTTPKGDKPQFQRVTYDEAYSLIFEGVTEAREKYGHLTMATMTGTSRFWAMGVWAMGYFLWGLVQDTGAGEVCKGPRRITGSLTVENGIFFNATGEMPLVYVQWGTDQTQSNYDDSCRTTVEASRKAKYFISIDPRISNCGKDADYILNLRPGTDQALALAWTRIVMEKELYNDYIMRYWSNGPFLYCEEAERTPGMTGKYNRGLFIEVKTRLLKESDLVEGGDPLKFMVWNEATDSLTYFDANEEGPHAGMWEGQTDYIIPETGWEYERGGMVLDFPDFGDQLRPALWGEYEVTLKDGRQVKCKTAFQKYWDDVVSYWTLDKAAEETEVDAQLIEEACLVWATPIDERRGNGGLNAQLAPEQCGNNIQTFRAIYLLFIMTDNYDTPAGNRGMTRCNVTAGIPQPAYVTVPSDYGPSWYRRAGICGAERYPLTRWTDDEADCSMVWRAANTGDPYPIKAVACGGGDFMNQSNVHYAYEALKQTDILFTIDLWFTPVAQLSDVILPACHWMEVPGWARMSQGAHGSIGAHQHCIDAPGEAMCDLFHCHNIYKKWGRPFFNPNTGNMTGWDEPIETWLDSVVAGEGFTWREFKNTFAEKGWWDVKVLHPQRWGTYRRYMYGYLRQNEGMQMKEWDNIPGTNTPTMKIEVWCTTLETFLSPDEPEHATSQVKNLTVEQICLPYYEGAPLDPRRNASVAGYEFFATTGRRIPVYFHNEHRQLPWCREQWPAPRVEINADDAKRLGIEQGDWVWIENQCSKIRQCAEIGYGLRPGYINMEHQWWFPESDTATKGFELCNCNCLCDENYGDPYVGSSAVRAYPVNIYKATPENCPNGIVCPFDADGVQIICDASDPRLQAWKAGIDETRENGFKEVQ